MSLWQKGEGWLHNGAADKINEIYKIGRALGAPSVDRSKKIQVGIRKLVNEDQNCCREPCMPTPTPPLEVQGDVNVFWTNDGLTLPVARPYSVTFSLLVFKTVIRCILKLGFERPV